MFLLLLEPKFNNKYINEEGLKNKIMIKNTNRFLFDESNIEYIQPIKYNIPPSINEIR